MTDYLFYLQIEKVGWFNWSWESMSETSETSFPRVAPELTMNLTNGPENQFNMQPFSDSDRSDSQLDMPLHSVIGVCIM